MAIIAGRTQIGVKETGTRVIVPNSAKAKLMYYLHCMNRQDSFEPGTCVTSIVTGGKALFRIKL